MTSEKIDKCIKCRKQVAENQNSICCDECNGWIHLKCSGLTKKKFLQLDSNTPFKCNFCLNFKCGKCNCPVFNYQNAVLCDNEPCNTWYHLGCTKFTQAEYKNKKSRLYTENWYCPNCNCIPFEDLPQPDFIKLQSDDTKLKEYFNFITCNKVFSKKCSVCRKAVNQVKKAFPCTSCQCYVHRTCTGIPIPQMLQVKPSQMKHWSCKTCVTDTFPFADIDDADLAKTTFNSGMKCSCSDKTEDVSLDKCETFKLVDKFLERDTPFNIGPDMNIDLTYDINSKCNYYSKHDFHKLTNSYKDNDKKPFTALHTNIQSLSHNFDSLENLCTDLDYPIDIIAVTETWNSEKKKHAFIPKILPGYEPYKGLTGTTLKSGCGLYIRSGLTYIERKDLDIQHHDDLNEFQMKFIEIVVTKSANIILNVTYRHPRKTSDSTFNDKLQETLTKIANEHKIMILLGDFNYNLFNHDRDNQTKHFVETMYTNSLQPTINIPTRVVKGQKPALLDNIFTNAIDKDIHSGNLTDKITDHMPNFLLMKNQIFDHKKINKRVRSFKNFDLSKYQEDIDSIDLTLILTKTTDVNEICRNIMIK